ncbi:NTP transferase domain-containing protein [Gleimia sp. 6138-11-ORH1]|uniref:bifunctional UDP-N-acetylglucosamine diphosphorylase/glucosamine-1-phosphate N-acetyltransferase GlmU n=1 Tax=Gleimia sp. 6138-11-ORH1 TaxID=2973937 RepID=UPI002166D4DD|nr:NTP transferase domain-containing protein [Gleimia sp. 6138-11-ORH1]MCS4483952.1 NTP transferase domain-containing protein [Gleimia sp. 6138-11-ORH1]
MSHQSAVSSPADQTPISNPTHPSAVIVLAAGQGTRMKSATPKVLHTMCGLPLVGHSIAAAYDAGADDVVVVVRHQREKVIAAIKEIAEDVLIADQDEIPGTGRAVQCGLAALPTDLNGTVIVTSADVPLLEAETLQALHAFHESMQNAVTVVSTLVEDPTGYGRMVRTGGNLVAIVEQRDATAEQKEINEINAGIYAFDAQFLRNALNKIGTDNDQGEVYLTDTVAIAVAEGRRCGAFILEDKWQAQGCNDRAQLADLRDEMNRRILDAHMKAGVSIVSPNTTHIDVTVEIGPDACIEPGAVLEGDTVVEPFAQIGPNTTLRNVHVGTAAVIAHCFLHDTEVAEGTVVPPFTYKHD